MNKFLLPILLIVSSCNTGNLKVIANLPKALKEVSGTEVVANSNVIWMLNDSGNAPKLYGLDAKGYIQKELNINAKNHDWEDLTTDKQGNIYIGDFGNNSKKRDTFTIYKVKNPEKLKAEGTTEAIDFTLPSDLKSEDFEAFFLFKEAFYMFSKNNGKAILIKVPNKIGTHVATLITKFKLKGKHTKITSADVSNDGKTVVLLNHSRLWKLSGFTTDNFFEGKLEALDFKHDSQKEGVCFIDSKKVLISDETKGNDGGNIYSFKL